MSKLIVNSIQTVGGTELALPAADGTAGQFMTTDGAGNLSFGGVDTSSGSNIYTKPYVLDGSSYNSSGCHIKWTDIKAGVDTDSIIQVRIQGHVRSTSNFNCYAMGLDASSSPITSGYLGYGRNEYYDGDNENNSNSHNSNNGHIWWSTYTTTYGSNSDTYGNGMMFDYTMIPQTNGSRTGHFHKIDYVYQQDTSYNHPNHGTVVWNNYGSSLPPATWHGVSIYPNSGSWNQTNPGSRVMVEIMVNE